MTARNPKRLILGGKFKGLAATVLNIHRGSISTVCRNDTYNIQMQINSRPSQVVPGHCGGQMDKVCLGAALYTIQNID